MGEFLNTRTTGGVAANDGNITVPVFPAASRARRPGLPQAPLGAAVRLRDRADDDAWYFALDIRAQDQKTFIEPL